jgi:hypothetical protein
MTLVEYKIRTGDFAEIKRGNLQGKLHLLYSGMPNDDPFALSPEVSQALLLEGFKFAPMIFYRKDRQQINVLGDDFKVVEVTPDQITLQFLKY